MRNRQNLLLITLAVMAVCMAAWSSPPANLSLRGIWDAVELGAHIASGTGSLPAVATEGARYTDISTPTAIIEYRSTDGAWQPLTSAGETIGSFTLASATDMPARDGNAGKVLAVSGAEDGYEWVEAASGASGVGTHSELTGLSFEDSGHTGFASEAALADLQPVASMSDFQLVASMIGFQPVASMTDYSAVASLTEHVADATDPHGASMTISEFLDIGIGPRDVSLCRISTGTLQIATRAVVLESFGIGSSTDPTPGIAFQIATGASVGILIPYQLQHFADQAAAVASGLATWTFYHSSGTLRIVTP